MSRFDIVTAFCIGLCKFYSPGFEECPIERIAAITGSRPLAKRVVTEDLVGKIQTAGERYKYAIEGPVIENLRIVDVLDCLEEKTVECVVDGIFFWSLMPEGREPERDLVVNHSLVALRRVGGVAFSNAGDATSRFKNVRLLFFATQCRISWPVSGVPPVLIRRKMSYITSGGVVGAIT